MTWRFVTASAIVVATVLCSPSAAVAAGVDVVVDSTDITLRSTGEGQHPGEVTLLNISDSLVTLRASIPGDEGCAITSDPTSVQAGRRATVTLTRTQGCDVETGADIRLRLGPQVKPASYLLSAAPVPATELRWPILGWSLLVAMFFASVVTGWVLVSMRMHNRRKHAGQPTSSPAAPKVSASDPGFVPAGSYRYAIAFVTNASESPLGAASNALKLEAPRHVELTGVPTGDAATISRRIYRSESGGEFFYVGEIADNTQTVFSDNWKVLRGRHHSRVSARIGRSKTTGSAA